jgi:uncharacterized protein (DUF983 family)
MFCPSCFQEYPKGANFCRQCKRHLEEGQPGFRAGHALLLIISLLVIGGVVYVVLAVIS